MRNEGACKRKDGHVNFYFLVIVSLLLGLTGWGSPTVAAFILSALGIEAFFLSAHGLPTPISLRVYSSTFLSSMQCCYPRNEIGRSSLAPYVIDFTWLFILFFLRRRKKNRRLSWGRWVSQFSFKSRIGTHCPRMRKQQQTLNRDRLMGFLFSGTFS